MGGGDVLIAYAPHDPWIMDGMVRENVSTWGHSRGSFQVFPSSREMEPEVVPIC